jgi:peptide/nickel transport system substrate-binding protein
MRKIGLLAVCASAAIGVALAGEAVRAETIRVAVNADIRSTYPGVNRDSNTDAVMHHIVEGLVAFTSDGSVAPSLAEKVETPDGGKTWVFTLRDGVTFHNGEPVTAEDVLFIWDKYLDEATKWRCYKDFAEGNAAVESIEKEDDRTVVFTLKQPSALFLGLMARIDCAAGAIVHEDSFAADGSWSAPIGTGPYKIGEWRQGEFIELEKFAGYKPRPEPRDGYAGARIAEADKVRFVVIPDGAATKAALLSGSIDVYPDISVNDVEEFKASQGVKVGIADTMNLSGILMQTTDPLLGKVKLREAIAHAIDTAGLVQVLTLGTAKPNNSPIPVVSAYHGKLQSALFSYDPERARKLAAEAGYKGETIKMLTTKRYQTAFDVAVIAQAMAKQAGINIELEVLEWATLLDKYLAGDYQMMSFLYSARLDPSLSFDMFSGPKAEQPRKVWDNPEAQALIEQSMRIADKGERETIFNRLEEMFRADVPMLVLYNGPDIAAYSDKLVGYEAWMAGTPRLWGVSTGK